MKIKNPIVLSIIASLVIYLTGCIFSADFNIHMWTEGLRVAIGTMWVIAESCIFAEYIIFDDSESRSK